jgi:uncharacterized membrane protein YfcA
MHFPVSGVQCPLWLPPLVAFAVALLATPAGISGAFLLLPFQMSVLGFVGPGVCGARLQKHLPERWIRLGPSVLLLCLAARYLADYLPTLPWNGIRMTLFGSFL